ncbi:MAG: division/cell wall cluster transcriptional repressor MraZ [Bacilli bacterium]
MFIGEYNHNIDAKGRLIVPSRFRDILREEFIITRGLDKCLFVYPVNEWEKLVNIIKALPFTKKKNRDFQRFFLSGATLCEIDKQGRVNISTSLINYAKLDKECVIVGVNERIEIWSKDEWNCFIDNNIDDLSDIAEDIFESDVSFNE